MKINRVDLTPAEESALESLCSSLEHSAWTVGIAESQRTLAKAVWPRTPEARRNYFTEAEFNIGRNKSRLAAFNCSQDEVTGHPHFLKYLKYFINGPALPAMLMEEFCIKAESCGTVTGGDIPELEEILLRGLRSNGLFPRDEAEEVFKLALESNASCEARTFRASMMRKRK